MNDKRARYVWDYHLTEEQFDAMLAGRYQDGHLNRDWAAVCLIEWAPYKEMIRRIGYRVLVENWPRWRPRLRSEEQKRSLDFLVDWLIKHHSELLMDHPVHAN
jgi:hypothetical protein